MSRLDGRGDEVTPLLPSETLNTSNGFGMIGGNAGDFSRDEGMGNIVLVTPLDEYSPPTFDFASGESPVVSCRVCQNLIDVSAKRDQHVVKCNSCNEATPIRNAPAGKKYVRCPCFCLLICKNTSQRIACPRSTCKRIISLLPSSPQANVTPVPNMPGMCRVNCGHCQDAFLFNTEGTALARCPHCRKISSVGGHFSKKRGLLFTFIGLALIVITLGVLFATLSLANTKGGLYVLYVGLFLLASLFLLRGFYYCKMKVSLADGPV